MVLLLCGIGSSLLYVATTLLGGWCWDGYSSVSQTVSELMAIDAPSRPLVVALFLGYGPLMIAFGLGVRGSAAGQRSLRVAGDLMVAYGVVNLAGPLVPMHLRGVAPTSSDALHIVVTTVLVLLILLVIGFAARAFGRRFLIYSIGTTLVLLASGALAGMDGARLAAGLPTPWMGVTERISIFAFMLWVVVLAGGLLRRGGVSWASHTGTLRLASKR